MMMYYKFIIPFLISCFFVGYAMGQQGIIKGAIYKKISSERLSQVYITNLNTKAVATGDDLGGFSIAASIGDTLLFEKRDYTPQRQTATPYGMIVYMQPEVKLNEVTVRGQTKKQELNEIMGDYRKQGTFYNGKPPVLSMLTSPLTGIYELFGKTPGRARKFAAFQKKELEATEVDKRYNPALVMRATGLTDTVAIKKFMEYYRPSFEDLKAWADYDLIKHIRTQYQYFKKNGDQVKLQKLY